MPAPTLQLPRGLPRPDGDGPALGLPTKKTLALLTYLALSPGRGHSREKLMALFWGDATERHARHTLRQALFALPELAIRVRLTRDGPPWEPRSRPPGTPP
jgi:DNA-binding SARP family transcriptional activator